jgi:CheY-like chemotaxis protein
MQTNLLLWIGGDRLDGITHLAGTMFLFVVLPIALLVLLVWAVKRSTRRPHYSHPIGRTMLPTELPRGKERVLLVDDDPIAIQVHSAILAPLGYKCHGATSGEAAVAYIRKNPTDIILLDLVMDPGINGVETLRQIRQISPKIRAILVSGYAKPSDVAAAQEMGAGAYLIKPVSSGMLATEVRRALDTRG